MPAKPTWKELLAGREPLLLPCAHDALSARLIERAGFAAYSIGGYALVRARPAPPPTRPARYGEKRAGRGGNIAGGPAPAPVGVGRAAWGDHKHAAHPA